MRRHASKYNCRTVLDSRMKTNFKVIEENKGGGGKACLTCDIFGSKQFATRPKGEK